MRQTAVKAVPFAKSGAKPQRESDETKNIEKRWGKIPELFQARSRVYYHRQVRTPIAKAMFGEYKIRQKMSFLSKKVLKMNIPRILRV